MTPPSLVQERVEPARARAAGRPRRRVSPLLAIGLGLLLVALLPARHAALRGDDEWTMELDGRLEIRGDSLLSHILDTWQLGLEGGRLQFIGGLQGDLVMHFLGDHPGLYRLLLIALTLVAAWLLWKLILRLGLPPVAGLLALGLLAGAIQFRAYHDAMLGYYGSTQTTLIFLLLSLLALLEALRTGRRGLWAASVALWAAACLVHEYAYPLCVVHLGLLLMEFRGRQAWRRALPFLGVGFAFALYGAVARRFFAPEATEGYEVSGSPAAIVDSFFTQLLPPLPASNQLFDPGINAYYVLGGDFTAGELLAGAWRGLAVAAIVAGAVWWLSGRPPVASSVLRRLAVIGALVWMAPVALVAVAPKYQLELSPGKGYLPVLIQVFGYVLVAVAVLLTLTRLAAGRSRWAVVTLAASAAGLLGFAAGVTGANNLRVVAMEVPVRETRDLFHDAVQRGLLAEVPERSTLLLSGRDTNWYTGSWVFGDYTLESAIVDDGGPLVDGRVSADTVALDCQDRPQAAFPPEDCVGLSPEAAWLRIRARPGGGSVIVGRLAGATPGTVMTAPAEQLRVYVEGEGTPPPPTLISQTPAGRPWTSQGLAWERESEGDGWAIYEADLPAPQRPRGALLDDAKGTIDFLAPAPPEQRVRIWGTRDLLP